MKLDGENASEPALEPAHLDKVRPPERRMPRGHRPNERRKKSEQDRIGGSWIISDDTKSALRRCELFQDIDLLQLSEVAALVEESSPEPNEMLLTEGKPACHVFVVVEGQGIAQLKLGTGCTSLGLVGPGDLAGWSSLIHGQLYPASVKALTPMKVAALETGGLTLLMNLKPDIGYRVQRRLSSIFYRQYQGALNATRTFA